jgi:NitT/TauT family transport system substrate-binding protein
MRKFGIILVTLFACLSHLTAKASSTLEVIHVGISPVISSAGVFIAQERGYFKEYGLTVELSIFRSSGAEMTALLSTGAIDVGGGNITAGLWNAKNSGVDIHLVADKGHVNTGKSYLALLVASDHVKSGRYKGYRDLKGFKMGLTALGVSQEIVTERFLRAAGLTLSDVTFVKMPYSEMNLALKTKMIDATVQLEPFVTQAVMDGSAVNVASVSEVYPEQPSAGIFYSPKFTKLRNHEAVLFMAAYLRGVRDYVGAFSEKGDLTERKKIIDILKKYTDILSDDVWSKMIPVGLNPDGLINKEGLKSDLNWYFSNRFLDALPKGDAVVDNSFVDAAIQLVGKYHAR